jgi:hypothetical protein
MFGNLLPTLFSFMRMVFWLTATALGSGAIIFLLASFTKPELAGHAISGFFGAIALLYARDATPASVPR